MRYSVVYPTDKTLEKYGLTKKDYKEHWKRHNGFCPICGTRPKNGRFNIDHEHVKGWAKMPPEKRKLFVRGLVCFFCNRYYLARAININKAANIMDYLSEYELRQEIAFR